MPNFDKVLSGVGVLIFVYLLFNSQQVGSVLTGLSGFSTNLVKALQGR